MDLYRIEAEGEPLIIRFINTVGTRKGKDPDEGLATFTHLTDWAREAGIIPPERAGELTAWAAADPTSAEALRLRAVQLRDAVYRLISAHAAGLPMSHQDVAILNHEVPIAYRRLQLDIREDHLGWSLVEDPGSPEALLWPLVRSAAELLTSPELERVGECQNPTCGWLFIDTSKNHSRRWCDMSDCGNKMKARNFYQRKRQQKASQ